jgi:hypothetical protein
MEEYLQNSFFATVSTTIRMESKNRAENIEKNRVKEEDRKDRDIGLDLFHWIKCHSKTIKSKTIKPFVATH